MGSVSVCGCSGEESVHTPGIREVERVVPHLVEKVATVPWAEGAVGAVGEVSLPLNLLCLSMVVR